MLACVAASTVLWMQGILLAVLAQPALGEDVRPVPQSACAPRDRVETGLQGQTTLAERFAPGPSKAYNCNLELIGQFEGEGAGHFMNAFGQCAYYTTFYHPELQHPGVVVLDVSNPRHPEPTAYLNSPAMHEANESLEFAKSRQLLLGAKVFDTALDIYDVSSNCGTPILKSTTNLSGMILHSGEFTVDGRTFYGAPSAARKSSGMSRNEVSSPGVYAIDTSEPLRPQVLVVWKLREDWRTHSLRVNSAGTRAYVVLMGRSESGPRDANGLVILDISEAQMRRPDPRFHVISTLFWDDTNNSEYALAARISTRDYLIVSDIGGGATRADKASMSGDCASGKPLYGFPRIIDISDEEHPRIVSKLMLQVHDPANCPRVIHDPIAAFGYGSFGCDVDNARQAKLLACSYFEGGLRVFDIRDPRDPQEIAYYKPPARRTSRRPGTLLFSSSDPQPDRTADEVIFPRFSRTTGDIWFTSADNGFQVVRFPERFKASHPDLFQ